MLSEEILLLFKIIFYFITVIPSASAAYLADYHIEQIGKLLGDFVSIGNENIFTETYFDFIFNQLNPAVIEIEEFLLNLF